MPSALLYFFSINTLVLFAEVVLTVRKPRSSHPLLLVREVGDFCGKTQATLGNVEAIDSQVTTTAAMPLTCFI